MVEMAQSEQLSLPIDKKQIRRWKVATLILSIICIIAIGLLVMSHIPPTYHGTIELEILNYRYSSIEFLVYIDGKFAVESNVSGTGLFSSSPGHKNLTIPVSWNDDATHICLIEVFLRYNVERFPCWVWMIDGITAQAKIIIGH